MKQNLITDIINKMRPAVIKNKFTTVEEYKRNNLIEQGMDITEEYNGVPVVIENKNFNNGFILSSMDTDIQHFIEEKLTSRCNRKDNAPSYIILVIFIIKPFKWTVILIILYILIILPISVIIDFISIFF